jgi:AraC-like DNA-binding protein
MSGGVVKNGQHPPVRSFRYEVTREPDAGIEAWTFAWLRGTPVGSRATIQRATDFHVLAIVRSGQGRVTVDFERHDLEPGVVVWIRPGRVHRWDDVASVAGTIVLFRPESATRSAPGGDFTGPIRWSQRSVGLLHMAADHLRREYEAARTETIPDCREVLRALLEVLLVRASVGAPPPPVAREAFSAFAASLEANFATSREVAWYARSLGFSSRTLSRATHEAVGKSAKGFIDDRVVLEAKRLLAYSRVTVGECAVRTEFEDAANFSKFFRTRTGITPGAFASGVVADPAALIRLPG